MQNYHVMPYQGNHEQEISQRTQHLVDSLKDLWNRPHKPSHEELNRILEFVVHLPDPYRAAALTTIAENLVSSLGLHYLDTVNNRTAAGNIFIHSFLQLHKLR